MIADRNRIYDGFISLEGGVDGGRGPTLIDPNQAVSAENFTFRGGRPKPRPGFRQLTESFTNPGHGYDAGGVELPPGVIVPTPQQAQTCYKKDVFQSVCAYSPHKGEDCLMALIGGRLFKIVPAINSAKVTEVTVKDSASPYITVKNRSITDGVIDASALDVLESDTAAFAPQDVNSVITCPKYPGGSTLIKEYVGPHWIRTTENATSAGTGIHFVIHNYNWTTPYRNNRFSPIAYMVQADKYLIAQDGISKAIIYDGKEARRSKLEGTQDTLEVPTGTMMAYGMGRLCVVVNERDVAFGDLYGSHLDKQTDPGDSIILFTERHFLTGGFDAAIPFQFGLATGIEFFPQLDSSTGNGQLLVFAERGATSFNLALDRTLWQTSLFQVIALRTTGLRGHRSVAVVNEDLWFRSDDGYRTYRQARSEASGYAHIPLSTNVGQFLDNDDGHLLRFASTIYFDNRIISTCSPVWNVWGTPSGQPSLQGRIAHQGLVVLDFNVLSSFGTLNAKPSWDGHWTIGNEFHANLPDIKISQLVTGTFNGVTRAFAFGLIEQRDSLGRISYQNQLYEFSFDDRDDFCGSIPWEMVTRAHDFKGGGQPVTPFTEQELYDGDIWISEVSQGGIVPK